MTIADILQPSRVASHVETGSKKRTLEYLSELIAADNPALDAGKLFERFLERERLGSTGLGKGIAIPHCRISGNDRAMGAFIRLLEPIDFDAIDGQPVDLIFALVVPEEATQEHLDLLAQLAEMFADPGTLAALRSAADDAGLYGLISRPNPRRASA